MTMTQNILFRSLMGYKESETLFAAVEMGLFDHLSRGKVSRKNLCDRLDLRNAELDLLIRMLKTMSLLGGDDQHVWLTVEGEKALSPLFVSQIHLERAIHRHWVYEEEIVRSVKGNRTFDANPIPETFLSPYLNLMYLNAAPITAVLSKWMPKTGKIAELGRSFGTLILPHCLRNPNLQGFLFADRKLSSWQDELLATPQGEALRSLNWHYLDDEQQIALFTKQFDLIVVYNTIHYFTPEVLGANLQKAFSLLCTDGKIIICDLFLDRLERGQFKYMMGVCIDWLTHGGIYHVDMTQAISVIEQAGLTADIQEFSKVPWTFIEITKSSA